MDVKIALVATGVFATAALLTWIVRRFALAHGVIDIPNARSSHALPTPRGGGLAIVSAASVGFVVLAWFEALDAALLMALLGGGLAVAAVGFFDDRRPLSPGIRLAVHVAAAIWALAWLGGLPPLCIGDETVSLGWLGHVLAVLGIVWTLNLFNFMDGIDGIAASQAVFMTAGAALLALVSGVSVSPPGSLVFAAACAGFLLWNWPPAKIFMGDVGSGYLGYGIAVFAIAAARTAPAAVWVWLILGGTFVADTSVTLLRRLARNERLYEAHRSHAYQWLARRWGTHRRVTIAAVILNLIWILPCALMATTHPCYAIWISIGAFLPLVILATIVGAGRLERGPA
jgi:Fuc2NAc and GlcNAc transferase